MDDVVLERLTLLRNEVADLKTQADHLLLLRDYVNDTRLRRATERGLQITVELCADIARRIIAIEGFRYPDDYQDTFRVLGEEGVVSNELLPRLTEMARFRNLLVHIYAKIDDAKVYGILKNRLGDFDAFAAAIAAYLERA